MQIGAAMVLVLGAWSGVAEAQGFVPDWAVQPELPHALLFAARFVAAAPDGSEAAVPAEPVEPTRRAPSVRVYTDAPLVLYAARVEGLARRIARRGLAVPERLRPDMARICRAPCETRLSRGHYVIEAEVPGAGRMPVAESVHVDGATDIEIAYVSRSTRRGVGLAMVIAGTVLGTAAVAFGPSSAGENESAGRYLFWGGLTVGLAISSIGSFFAFQPDTLEAAAAPR